MRGSDLSPQTPGRWPKSAALSGDDEESQNRQHNVRDEGRRKWLALHLLDIGKDALLVLVFVFHLSNFGRDTFELGIELVDNRLPLSTMASDVDGFGGKSQIEPSYSSYLLRRGGWRAEPDKARKAIGCVLTVMSRNIHRMSPKTKCAGEFQGAWPGLTSANLISFARIGAHTIRAEKVK